MVLHQDVFKKAQAEIDQVTGSDRLLDFDDRESLPYFDCVVKEVLRYVLFAQSYFMNPLTRFTDHSCPIPLGSHSLTTTCSLTEKCITGVPHRVMDDDQYRGYLIPNNSTVLANIW